jgi:SAM-dependent methyltransferase
VKSTQARRSFDELVAEAEEAPILGWDFSWLDGRAIEERPTWRYFDRVAERAAGVDSLLELQVGSGSMIAALPTAPHLTVGTEGYAPNVASAACALSARGAHLVHADDERAGLPFRDELFELVVSRHPITTPWREIARVLRPGGSYLSQQVGPYSLRDLTGYLMGPQPERLPREPEALRRSAEAAGFVVTDLRHERPLTSFFDIGAVVYFLRLVVWIVPGFSVSAYRERLQALHEQIEREGGYHTTASRILIEAQRA